jgi:adenylate kinase family enzyme
MKTPSSDPKRILISGGPGSGCSSTALALSRILGIPVFDSDDFFHKPTDPPFREQFTPEERRLGLAAALAPAESWILSGSVATWAVPNLDPTHGVFLDVPNAERLARLEKRQRGNFGSRIDSGGDLEEEHQAFLQWAATYEDRETGRSRKTDLTFLNDRCPRVFVLSGVQAFVDAVLRISGFLGSSAGEEASGQRQGRKVFVGPQGFEPWTKGL